MYVPKNMPILKGLNSYYIDLEKLINFYKASMLSGCIHLKNHEVEAAVFLSRDTIQGVICEQNGLPVIGEAALRAIFDKAEKNNLSVDIYEISEENVKFCSNIPNAKPLHSNISTEFIDVKKMLHKLLSDKITGFLEITFEKNKAKRFIFLNSGIIIGSSDSSTELEYRNIDEVASGLIGELESAKGTLNVKIILQGDSANGPLTGRVSAASVNKNAPLPEPQSLIDTVGSILSEVSQIVSRVTGNREKFDIILKRKFLQKADRYTFLDPFEEEVAYDGKRFSVNASIEPSMLIEAMRECLLEIGAELGVPKEIENELRALS